MQRLRQIERKMLQAVSGFNFLAIRAGMTGLLLTAAAVGVTCAMLEKEPKED